MICPSCSTDTDAAAEACFTCGKALHALTQGTVLAGRYEIVSPLGVGGMGRVYQAFDRVLEEHVALKVLRPEFAREPEMARRFLSEIKLARKVSHPNVCRIHEYGEENGLRYISMELVEGVSLKDHLRAHALATAEAFDLALGIAAGLRAVHERGIIHRDFKTSNIMVDAHGRVRLLDFGIARVAGADTGTFTAAGHVLGTPEYMSPEQALGAKLDFRSDIYALGCVVFEIFSGQAVFQGETPLATLFKHINEAPPLDAAWARLPSPLAEPLRVALAKDPTARFETVAEFQEALLRARAQCALDAPVGTARTRDPGGETATILRPTPAPADTAPVRPGGTSTLRRAVIGAALALLAATALTVRLRSPGEPPAGAGVREPGANASPASPATSAASPGRPSPQPAVTSTADAARHPEPTPRPTATPVPQLRAATRLPELEAAGILRITVVPPSEVTVDGRLVGTVSTQAIDLAPGPHTVRVLHPDYKPLQRIVTIPPGGTFDLALDLAEKGIRLER
jgi:serine/threonine-protein kinase